MNLSFADIIGVNEAQNTIKIKDMYNNAVYDVPLSNHMHFQSMPVLKDICMYANIEDKGIKIVKIWEIRNDPNIRQGLYTLQSGELQLQGLYGQYIYLDNNGNITFVDSTMLNSFQLGLNGFIANLNQWNLTTYDGINILINKDFSITRTGGGKNVVFSFIIDDDSMTITNNKSTVTLTNDGNLTFTISNNVIVNANGKIQLQVNGSNILECDNTIENLKKLITEDFLQTFNTHTHPTTSPGVPTSVPTTLASGTTTLGLKGS
jgi:hypothetical protein